MMNFQPVTTQAQMLTPVFLYHPATTHSQISAYAFYPHLAPFVGFHVSVVESCHYQLPDFGSVIVI
jgi:hypothetical protein